MGKFYITTTIPYVNAAPHIGHAQEFAEADAYARYRKARGDEVYFLSGSDENAIKNVEAAEKAGIPVGELVAKNSEAFKNLLSALGASNDQFIRTTEERHVKGVQALWRAAKKEDIYKKTYRGLYCVGCELFYAREELNEKGECGEHPGKPLEEVEEENYFFRLSAYADQLQKLIKSDELKIVPMFRKNEVVSFIERGLEDFSISRPVSRSKGWGIRVPEDQSQTVYVWYDALANYITALGYPDAEAPLYKEFWSDNPNRLHILGKGVSRFHAIYWPAMLLSAGLPLPTVEFIHGYVTVEGQKMSKTIGNVTNPADVIRQYGAEAVRYYLLREIPAYEDGDFSARRFEERYSADLANGLGNFASRVLALGEKYGEMRLPLTVDPALEKKIQEARGVVERAMDEFKFHEAVGAIWELIAFGDGYVNEKKPWLGNSDKEAVPSLVVLLDNIAGLLAPFLPGTAERITSCIRWSDSVLKVTRGEMLFPRLD